MSEPLSRAGHAQACGCCLFVLELIASLQLGDKLDALHRLYTGLDEKAGKIMAAQDDINAAVTDIQAAVTAIGTAITDGVGAGTPVDTSALVTASSNLSAAVSQLAAATNPAPAPVAAPADHPASPFA